MDPKLAEIFERNRLERERRKKTRAPAQETPVAEQTAIAPAPRPTKTLEQEFGAEKARQMRTEARARDNADRRRLPDY